MAQIIFDLDFISIRRNRGNNAGILFGEECSQLEGGKHHFMLFFIWGGMERLGR